MKLTEIRVAGFGGQGVILAATVIGKAACLFQNGYATMTQSFGPEARGGACSAQVVLSDEPILYPYVTHPDVLIVMSQEAYMRFAPEVRTGAIVLVEQELVRVSELNKHERVFSVPATRLAEELGRRLVLNIVMVGFFAGITGLLEVDALRSAVADSVPPHLKDLNLRAFEKGLEYACRRMEARREPEEEHVATSLESH